MELLFLGLAVGAILTYFVYARFAGERTSGKAKTQAVVLMERIRAVCKLITVEGDFSEIYHYESLKTQWVNKLLGTKRAIVIIDAKAHVGFDLTAIHMVPDLKTKTIKFSAFPEPKLLAVDTNFKFYDKKEGWANPFSSADLTAINKEAKQHILDKIPESGLYLEAKQQALHTIELMESLVSTIGWKIDFSALEVSNTSPDKISKL